MCLTAIAWAVVVIGCVTAITVCVQALRSPNRQPNTAKVCAAVISAAVAAIIVVTWVCSTIADAEKAEQYAKDYKEPTGKIVGEVKDEAFRAAAADYAFSSLTSEQHIAKAKADALASKWGSAHKHLDAVPDSHPQKKAALADLATREKKALAEDRKQAAEARRQYAKTLERILLDRGLDARVTTQGANAETLRLQYVLMSRALADQLNQELRLQISGLEFKKAIFTDGYNETWQWQRGGATGGV